MHALSAPEAILTCGADRRVKMWGQSLEQLGALRKSVDPGFQFPYDRAGEWRKRLDEATELLRKIGPLQPSPRKSSTSFDLVGSGGKLPDLVGGRGARSMRNSVSDTSLLPASKVEMLVRLTRRDQSFRSSAV